MNNLRRITRVSVNLFLVQALNNNSFIKLRVSVKVPVRESLIYKYLNLLQKTILIEILLNEKSF